MKKILLVLFVMLLQTNLFSMEIHNGINQVDLNSDGKNDLIVKGHVHNISAHDYDVISFYIYHPIYKDDYQIIETVKFQTFTLKNSHGAECTPKDIFIVKSKSGQYDILVIQKPVKKGYGQKETINYTLYSIGFDDISQIYFFKKNKKYTTNKEYCDVMEAYKSEIVTQLQTLGYTIE